MTHPLIFLAKHAPPALLCPWTDTKQLSPSSRWKHKVREEGKCGKQLSFLLNYRYKQHNPKHMLRWRWESMFTISAVYADQCAIIALVVISESATKRKHALGLLSILEMPVWVQSYGLEMQPKRAPLFHNRVAFGRWVKSSSTYLDVFLRLLTIFPGFTATCSDP